MLALFGDESYDHHTYVLGGWLEPCLGPESLIIHRVCRLEWRELARKHQHVPEDSSADSPRRKPRGRRNLRVLENGRGRETSSWARRTYRTGSLRDRLLRTVPGSFPASASGPRQSSTGG